MFESDDCELSEHDIEVLNKITAYEDYLENPNNYGGVNKEYYTNTQTEKGVLCYHTPAANS